MNLDIGSRVRVVGPEKDEYNLPSDVFEIAQLRVTADGLEYSTNGFPWFPEESLELVDAPRGLFDEIKEKIGRINRRDHKQRMDCCLLTSRIQALEKWQAEHDLEKSSRFPGTMVHEQTPQVGEIRDFADTRPVHVEMADLEVIKVGDFRSLKAIRGLVQASVGPETTSDELALLDRLIEAARAVEEDA